MKTNQTPSIQLRIRFSTYQSLKKSFPPHSSESFANYFERLAEFIKGKKQ